MVSLGALEDDESFIAQLILVLRELGFMAVVDFGYRKIAMQQTENYEEMGNGEEVMKGMILLLERMMKKMPSAVQTKRMERE